MKKITLLATLFFSVITFSQTFNYKGLEYTITSTVTPFTVKVKGQVIGNTDTTITIPNTAKYLDIIYNVTRIGPNAFKNKNLTYIDIPNTIIAIDELAFSNNQLTYATIPSGVRYIGPGAFQFNKLTSIAIPDSVTFIGNQAFTSNQLTNITISKNITNIQPRVFYDNQLTNVIIPEGVTHIGFSAFRYNKLTSITISKSVTNIGTNAFNNNLSLTNVVSTSTNPAILLNNIFGYNKSSIDLEIPTGTAAVYATANWTGFKSITEDITLSIKNPIPVEKALDIDITDNRILVKILSNIKLKELNIYNLMGVKVMSSRQPEISIESLTHGVYILKTTYDKGLITHKFIK